MSQQCCRLEVAGLPKQRNVQPFQVGSVIATVEPRHIRHQSRRSLKEGAGQQAPESGQALSDDHDSVGPPDFFEVNEAREDVLHSLGIVGAIIGREVRPVHSPRWVGCFAGLKRIDRKQEVAALRQFLCQWRGRLRRSERGFCALRVNNHRRRRHSPGWNHRLCRDAVLNGSAPDDQAPPRFVSSPRSIRQRPPPQIVSGRRSGHERNPEGGSELLAVPLQFRSILGNGFLQPLTRAGHKILSQLLGIERLGRHLPAIENQQASGIKRKVLAFFLGRLGRRPDGVFSQPAGEELINGLAAEAVVIVLRRDLHAGNTSRFVEQRVDGADGRVLDAGNIASPIPGRRNHEQGARCCHGSDFDVIRVDAKIRSILANVSSLHEVRNHIDRSRHAHTLVHSRQQERLRPSARSTGHGNALRVNIRE